MLILKRKVDEKIIVRAENSEVIEIMVVDVDKQGRGSARLGVKAPKSWSVHREEIDEVVRGQEERLRGYADIGSVSEKKNAVSDVEPDEGKRRVHG